MLLTMTSTTKATRNHGSSGRLPDRRIGCDAVISEIDDHDRHQAGYADEFHERGDFAALIGDDVPGANNLRDIMNRRAEKNACGDVVVLRGT